MAGYLAWHLRGPWSVFSGEKEKIKRRQSAAIVPEGCGQGSQGKGGRDVGLFTLSR